MPGWLEQVMGAFLVLVLVVLTDVFLTVLYARAGAGIISSRVSRDLGRVPRGGGSARITQRRRSRLSRSRDPGAAGRRLGAGAGRGARHAPAPRHMNHRPRRRDAG